ncbi:MAG: RagB/SusD family nutrient uptake outer membrane protein [Saprospiraceae bacterium]|nr:RagB/SusD family nutrient uptake outer membrane protein [Saprospiraceae bacterium]
MTSIIKITLVATTVLTLSCNFLEVTPESEITSNNFFKTSGDVEAAVISIYDAVQSFTYSRDVMMIPDIQSDQLRAQSGGNFTNHQNFTASPAQGNVNQAWETNYQVIQRSLDVLENIDAVTDPALNKEKAKGEAYFCRGQAYFNLVRLFGKVPIIEKATKDPTQDLLVKRAEIDAVYQQIIADLSEAEKLLPATAANKYRATKGAARAMLARAYMQRNDFAKALTKCEEVMNDPQYKLVAGANYADIFTTGKQNTSESIWEISNRPNVAQEGNSNFDGEMVPAAGNGFRVRVEQKVIDAFTATDLRKAASIGNFNNNNYVKKHEAGPPTITTNRRLLDPNIVVLRLADIILLRAECLNETSKTTEAIPLLNQIRNRAGLPNTTAVTQAEVRKAIEDERFLELCFEGVRWYDLVRTKKVKEVVPNFPGDEKAIWPVPSRELDLNPNLLPQNPGY